MMSEGELRRSVLDTAGMCPFCGYEPEIGDVSRTVSREYDEEYYGVECRGCAASYGHDAGAWLKPTPPGEDAERVRVR